jgi:hypothetical protein
MTTIKVFKCFHILELLPNIKTVEFMQSNGWYVIMQLSTVKKEKKKQLWDKCVLMFFFGDDWEEFGNYPYVYF